MNEPLSSPDIELGKYFVRLLLESSTWVRRCVESVRLLDEYSGIRRISVDFEVPNPTVAHQLHACPVPLAILRKDDLYSFDLRDEHGATLPLLTSTENSRLVHSAVMAIARELNLNLPTELVGILREVIEEADPEEGQSQLSALASRADETGEACKSLMMDSTFRFLMELFARKYALVVELPYEPGRRRVLKFSYVFRMTRLKRGFLGWRATRWTFRSLTIGHCGSTHVDVQIPSDLLITKREFRLVFPGSGVQRKRIRGVGRYDHWRYDRFPSGYPTGTEAWATISLRPPSGIVVRPSFVASAVAALVLWTLSHFGERIDSMRLSAAASILLAVPAALTTLVARRQNEHPLASNLLLSVRTILFLSALLIYTAAGILLFEIEAETKKTIWIWLAGGASLNALLLGITFSTVGISTWFMPVEWDRRRKGTW